MAQLQSTTVTGTLTLPSYVAGFVKLNSSGAVVMDTNTYITGITSGMITTALGYTPVPTTRTLTINGTAYDLSADRSWTIAAGVASVTASGAGISASPTTGAVVISNTGVTSNVAGTGISVSGATGAVTITNTGVTSIVAGTGISISGATGAVTVTNSGVTSVNGSSGAITGVLTTSNYSSTLDSVYLKGTTSPSTPGNFTLSIGNNGSYSYVQSHSSQPLYLNPLGNAVFIGSGNTVLHSGNYNSYAPTLTGGGASGTWGINITGNSATTSQRSFSGDISTGGMGRFTGWYTGTAATTLATEVGVSSGEGYIIVYNRNSSSYGTLNLNAVNIRIDPQGGIATVAGSQIVTNNGGTWGINITGNSATTSQTNFTTLTLNSATVATQSWVTSQGYVTGGPFVQNVLGDSGAFNLNVSGQQAFFRFSTGSWVNAPIAGNYSHVLSVNGASDNRTVQIYLGDVPGYLWWRPNQGGTWHPWERILTSNNYNGWAPTLTGGGASGTWGINITGGAGSANIASQVTINYNNDSNSSYQLLWGSGNSVYGTSDVWVNPSSDIINARGGFISNGNPWGTSNSAYFPNGITTAGGTNWVYGSTYIGNAPGNGSGSEVSSVGSFYFRNANTSGSWGYAGLFVDRNNAANNYVPYSFEAEYGNHSWGIVARFHIQTAGQDKPAIQFTSAGSNERWSIGYCTGSDFNFRITQNQGYRTDNSASDGWGTERFRIDTSGTVSVINAFNAYSIQGNSNVAGTGNASYHPSGIYSTSTNWLYGTMYLNNNTIFDAGNIYNSGWYRNYGQTGLYSQTYDNHFASYDTTYWRLASGSGLEVWSKGFGAVRGYLYTDGSSFGLLNSSGQWAVRAYGGSETQMMWNGSWRGIAQSNGFRVNGNLYTDVDYGYGLVGVYASTRYQGVFAMGDAYKLPSDGTSTGNLYGLAWSHPNAGGVAGNLNTHGLLVLENGTFLAAVSGSIRARDDMRAPRFYDSNDTSYYCDPASESNLYRFTGASMTRNAINYLSINSPFSTRSAQSSYYLNGTMGWGNTSFNSIGSYWGSGFIDTWSNPANAPGGSSHYVGMQAMHYNDQNGTNFHGWQMACAQEADNRWFWRSSWNSPRSWVEMIHSGNIGSQSVNYASSAGNADTVDGYHATFSGNANTIPVRNGSGYLEPNNWIQFNGQYGLYDPTNGAHQTRNNHSYGSWKMTGERNGWRGLHFGESTGITLMMNEGEFGFHRENVGWVARFTSGTGYFNITGNAATATSATFLNSSNYINRCGSSGNANTDFQNTPAGSVRHNGDDANLSNSPGGTWWFYDNYRHSNGGNFWGVQVAWGWEDNANRLATRNVSGGSFGGWVYYLNSSNFSSWAAPNGGVLTNTFYFQSNLGAYSGSLSSPPLQAYATGGNSAFFSFHRSGNYAVNMGLDADNWIRIGGWSAASNRLQLDMSGNLTLAGDVTAYSDARVKENIVTVEDALDKVLNLRGVYYNRTDSDDKRRKVGVIAQEILEVIPEVVGQDNDGMYNVSYGNIVGVLIEAIKEQQKQIDELKAKLDGTPQ